MKWIIISTLVLAFIGFAMYISQKATCYSTEVEYTQSFNLTQKFHKWEQSNQKRYNGKMEELYRQSVFFQNQLEIESFNSKNQNNSTVILTPNEFSDMTEDEFKQSHFGLINDVEEINKNFVHPDIKKMAKKFNNKKQNLRASQGQGLDYRYLARGITVRSQKCGDCWANTAVAVTEMAFTREKLSVQEVTDCTSVLFGCNGGHPFFAVYNIIQKGVSYDRSYKYTGKYQDCKDPDFSNKDRLHVPSDATMSNFMGRDEAPKCDYLKAMLHEMGPVNIAIYAETSTTWRNYKGGILQHKGDEPWVKTGITHNVNHAVVLVGYTDEYWIIQNSWGTRWGIDGYAKIKMGDQFNMCHQASGYTSRNSRFHQESPEKKPSQIQYVVRNDNCDENSCTEIKQQFSQNSNKQNRMVCAKDAGKAKITYDGSYITTLTTMTLEIENEFVNNETFKVQLFRSPEKRFQYNDKLNKFTVMVCNSQYGIQCKYQKYCKKYNFTENDKSNKLPQRLIMFRNDDTSCGVTILDQQ